jgi:hypothetical protein
MKDVCACDGPRSLLPKMRTAVCLAFAVALLEPALAFVAPRPLVRPTSMQGRVHRVSMAATADEYRAVYNVSVLWGPSMADCLGWGVPLFWKLN